MHKIKGEIAPLFEHLSMKTCVTGDKASFWNHVISDLPHYDHASDFFLIFKKYSTFLSTANFLCNLSLILSHNFPLKNHLFGINLSHWLNCSTDSFSSVPISISSFPL